MYSVKYGKWVHEGDKRFWTGTKEQLLAAKEAGEVSDGDMVVVIDPEMATKAYVDGEVARLDEKDSFLEKWLERVSKRLRVVGQIVMSVGESLEGYLLCDGKQFDKDEYPELYAYLQDDHTPDLREAAPVGAGRRESKASIEHDEFKLKEFKDDCLQRHYHSRGTQEISGVLPADDQTLQFYQGSFYVKDYSLKYDARSNYTDSVGGHIGFAASRTWTGTSSAPETSGTSEDYVKVTDPPQNPNTSKLYEQQAKYKKSEDERVNYYKKYFENGGSYTEKDLKSLKNPSTENWYEEDGSNDDGTAKYKRSTDTNIDPTKKYYKCKNNAEAAAQEPEEEDGESGESCVYEQVDLGSLANPKNSNWYEEDGTEYVLTEDVSPQDNKQYYEKVASSRTVRTAEVTRGKRFGVNFFIAY